MSFGWDYPPGVTGNEPQISGEWPCDECGGLGYDEDEDGKHACFLCEGKGYLDGSERHGYCVGCGEITDRLDDEHDWLCEDCKLERDLSTSG